MEARIKFYLEIADNALILSHRLSENCSKGPFLEEDLATTNVALDLIGLAESVYEEVARLESKGQKGDDLAYKREAWEYYNSLLVEQPNTDFAYLMVRQFFTDVYHFYFFDALSASKDEFLAALATKSLKEIKYHLKRSSEWMIRFGLGTKVSKEKGQKAIDELFPFTWDLFSETNEAKEMKHIGFGVDLDKVYTLWLDNVKDIFHKAGFVLPDNTSNKQVGGKDGLHSEKLGYILTEMQYLPAKYQDAVW
jgi:ring-1,2-phenylacetyl-CoA epoxidase subunit PaaC